VCTTVVPANMREALGMLESAAGFLAGLDAAVMPAQALAEGLHGMERADAVQAAARGRSPGRRAADHPGLAGAHPAGNPRAGRRA
jgi:hypothetical protein